MITEYNRPETLEDLFAVLSRKDPKTIIIGGGLYINEVVKEPIAVADIQSLGLDEIKTVGKIFQIGPAATLQSIHDAEETLPALRKAITHQETNNRRQVATLAGTLVSAGGRSAVAGAFLALDSILEITGPDLKSEKIHFGDYKPLSEEKTKGRLISLISIPTEVKLAYHYVARTPADLPIVGAFAARWPSGRTRVVLIGFGEQPVMVFDGPDGAGAEDAARDAYSEAVDQWASAEYRAETARILVERCLDEISGS